MTAYDISTLAGIACWGDSLTAASYPAALGALLRADVFNGGVASETSTQIGARFAADPERQRLATVIWAGRNNVGATARSDIAVMVAMLPHTEYVVLSVLNNSSEPAGSAGYNAVAALNADLASDYGGRFLDVRAHLVGLYDPLSAQDVLDHGNDIVPTSLRVDSVHLTAAGYAAVAQYVADHCGFALLTDFSRELVNVTRATGRAKVHRDQATQSISSGVLTSVSFDRVAVDDGGYFDAGNPARLKVPPGYGGWHRLAAQAVFTPNATGNRALSLQVNGIAIATATHAPAATNHLQLNVAADMLLVPGDLITAQVYQASGAALNLATVAPGNWLAAVRESP